MKLVDQVRQVLKENGYNNRKISVTDPKCRALDAVNVVIKDKTIAIKEIEQLVSSFQKSYYDARGEVVAGGEVYVRVTY